MEGTPMEGVDSMIRLLLQVVLSGLFLDPCLKFPVIIPVALSEVGSIPISATPKGNLSYGLYYDRLLYYLCKSGLYVLG